MCNVIIAKKEIYISKKNFYKYKKHYCNKKCYYEYKKNNKHITITKNKNVIKIIKICPICKKEFIVPLSIKKRIYCSKECYLKDNHCIFRKNGKGGKRNNSGRGKKGLYKGYWCDSSWELAFVIYNLQHNIKFKRNEQEFEYEYLGQIHKFYPDFILEDGTFIEIKGYMSKQNIIKINSFNYLLKVIDKNKIKPYLDYVKQKYGKDFIKLYEINLNKKNRNKCLICSNPCKNIYCSRKCSIIGARKCLHRIKDSSPPLHGGNAVSGSAGDATF